jgi:hypothetical protein
MVDEWMTKVMTMGGRGEMGEMVTMVIFSSRAELLV